MADEPPAPAPVLPPALPQTPPPPPLHPRRPRLPGTYAGNYLDDDPSPITGAVILGGLFAIVFAVEALGHFTEIFSGVRFGSDLGAIVRLSCGSFALFLLWLGLGWVRWPLAGISFVFGTWLLVQMMAVSSGYYAGKPGGVVYYGESGSALLTHRFEAIPTIAMGFIYLGLGTYLAFSSNVLAFAKQQREPGKALSIVPVITLCGLGILGLLAMRPLCIGWAGAEEQGAIRFGDECVRAISAHWDYKTFDERADEEFVTQWPAEAQQAAFGSIAPFGAARQIDSQTATVAGGLERSGGGLEWRAHYASHEQFEHGTGRMTFELHRGLFSPWRIASWSMSPENRPTPP